MISPNYKEIINSDLQETTQRTLHFDKLWVEVKGDAKYSKTELLFHINQGCRRRNINLVDYIQAVNDYFISHPCWKQYKKKKINVFDFSYIRVIKVMGLKISGYEFQIMRDQYPNLFSVETKNCTIYKEVSVGSLNCIYTDYCSDIMSLDSLNGFSGKILCLHETNVRKDNQRTLTLNCEILELHNVDIRYENFFSYNRCT